MYINLKVKKQSSGQRRDGLNREQNHEINFSI